MYSPAFRGQTHLSALAAAGAIGDWFGIENCNSAAYDCRDPQSIPNGKRHPARDGLQARTAGTPFEPSTFMGQNLPLQFLDCMIDFNPQAA